MILPYNPVYNHFGSLQDLPGFQDCLVDKEPFHSDEYLLQKEL